MTDGLKINILTVGYILFILFSGLVIGYMLLRYEPRNQDTWVFIIAFLAFLLVTLLLMDTFSMLLFGEVEGPNLLRAVGAIIWWLAMLGFVLLRGKHLLS